MKAPRNVSLSAEESAIVDRIITRLHYELPPETILCSPAQIAELWDFTECRGEERLTPAMAYFVNATITRHKGAYFFTPFLDTLRQKASNIRHCVLSHIRKYFLGNIKHPSFFHSMKNLFWKLIENNLLDEENTITFFNLADKTFF